MRKILCLMISFLLLTGCAGSFSASDSEKELQPEYTYHLRMESKYDVRDDQTVQYELLKIEESEEPQGAAKAVDSINDAVQKDIQAFENQADRNHIEDQLTVVRADSVCLSVMRETEWRSADGDEQMTYSAYSYNAEDGEKFKLEDVISDLQRLEDVLEIQDWQEWIWVVDYDGISFIDPQDGSVIAVSKEQHPELFSGKYGESPASYGKKISLNEAYTLDGKDLQVNISPNEFGETVQVLYGEEETSLDLYAYSMQAYLLKDVNRKYLYMDGAGDNDLHDLYVIDLDQDELAIEKAEGLGFWNIPVDPKHIVLKTRTQLISTFEVCRSYHPDSEKGGFPAADEKYFMPVSEDGFVNPVFTMKQDAQLDVLDDEGNEETHSEIIAQGTRMEMIRTDNLSIVDCQCEDGRIVRFYVDASDWPHIVDGQYVLEDLLDGTVFAG